MAFSQSTQQRNWMFSYAELDTLRTEINQKARDNYRLSRNTDDDSVCFTVEDEVVIVRKFLYLLKRFHKFFKPTLPDSMYGIAASYFKRFYLHHSVMDFYPREIMLTSLYLACKAGEFNVSMNKFVENIPRNKEKYQDFILNSELFLIEELNFDLVIHLPYKPCSGFIIDYVTYISKENSNLSLSDSEIQEWVNEGYILIDTWYQTDFIFVYSPSQIGLKALSILCRRNDDHRHYEYFQRYVSEHLCSKDQEKITSLTNKLTQMENELSTVEFMTDFSDLKQVEERMETCRNQLYNPDSDLYKQKKAEAAARFGSLE